MAGEKRSQDTEEEPQRSENIIIVDIEGTTTSISFVKETLFPYVREHLKEYIEKNWENAEFKEDLEKLKEQAKKDESDKVEGVIPITSATTDEEKETVLKNIQWQMDNDRKSTALKQLQGHMWREAYKSGGVKGHVYDDVPKALDEWTTSGKKIYVYSSGSVEAQKLLFGHSTHGDLLKHFADYFDTEIGAKQEASSYKAIASKIDTEASKILFLTDIPNEAKAAIEAGFSSVLVVREGNEPLSTEEKSKFSSIKSFLDLSFKSSAKRQKLEEPKESAAKKEDEKNEEKPEKKEEEPEDIEMKDVSDKKPEKTEEKKDSEKLKAPEDKEPPKEAAEPEKSPEKSPTIEKEPEEPKKPSEEPEKMEIEKEIKKNDEKDDKSDDKLPEIKEIKETKTDDAKKEDKINKTDEIKDDNEKIKEIDDKKLVDEKKIEDSKKVDDKIEKIEKIEEKKEEKLEEKENGGEVKQNGDKSSETIEEKKIVKELNGDSKKKEEDVKEDEKKEAKEIIEEEKKEKIEKKEKEEEKKGEDSEKKVNGNTDNEEKSRISEDTTKTTSTTITTTTTTATSNKNGESSVVDDKESIKIKKVVDSIVDGAGDTDVVTPVAVVAATS